MQQALIPDNRTKKEKATSYRYWAGQSFAAKFAETMRLSVEHYGTPIGDIRDGPFVRYQRMPDGNRRILSEWSGPNPVRHESLNPALKSSE